MKILIAGCGYVGTALGEACVAEGDEVWALRRNEEILQKLSNKGLHPIKADLLDNNSLLNIPSVDVVVFSQAISKSDDSYESTYLQGTSNLLSHFSAAKPRVIFISSTSVYGTHDGSWVDESIDAQSSGYPNPDMADHAKILLAAEKVVIEFGGMVLRLSGIYGPGRNRIAAIKSGKLKPLFTDIYTNRVHRDDIVLALQLLIQKGRGGEVYIGSDDYPSTQREFHEWIFHKLHLPISLEHAIESTSKPHSSNKRCSNAKIKALGLQLKYPTFREGYEKMIHESTI